jgi:hypothetical protein
MSERAITSQRGYQLSDGYASARRKSVCRSSIERSADQWPEPRSSPRSNYEDYNAAPVRCIGWLCVGRLAVEQRITEQR